jgi:UDP-N-acetylglucosamine 2-epimerase (non-hydrolysing)
MKIISVVGARPNFMKIAPFCHAIERHNESIIHKSGERRVLAALEGGSSHAVPQQPGPPSPLDGSQPIDNETSTSQGIESGENSPHSTAAPISHILVHTGQHYDERMSKSFFDALDIPRPDIDLEVGSGTHAEQVGNTMIAFEKVLQEHRPDWVVVVGDVNATCACSITAKKEGIKVAHIEAGLRSFDMAMPEEINRLVTDRLSDLLLTPDRLSSENLRKEGVPEDRIAFVGNIMIDTLEAHRAKAKQLDPATIVRDNLLGALDEPATASRQLPLPTATAFALMTMHRPSNVDRQDVLKPILDFLLDEICSAMPLIWPIHPRANKQLQTFGLWERAVNTPNLILLHPLGYHEMLRLNMDAAIMLTDSGGLQEECCVLGTPCLTLRWNTERPVTLREHGGASVLVGNNVERLRTEFFATLHSERKPHRPDLWDGRTADRIVEAILKTSL